VRSLFVCLYSEEESDDFHSERSQEDVDGEQGVVVLKKTEKDVLIYMK